MSNPMPTHWNKAAMIAAGLPASAWDTASRSPLEVLTQFPNSPLQRLTETNKIFEALELCELYAAIVANPGAVVTTENMGFVPGDVT